MRAAGVWLVVVVVVLLLLLLLLLVEHAYLRLQLPKT
jgi:uncharacterized integral membrane protein